MRLTTSHILSSTDSDPVLLIFHQPAFGNSRVFILFRGAMGAWIKNMEPQAAYTHDFDNDHDVDADRARAS